MIFDLNSNKTILEKCVFLQSEEERQAQLRERARKLLADARRFSGPTTEIIRVSPESMKAYIEGECKKFGDEILSSDKIDNKSNTFNNYVISLFLHMFF